MKYQSSNTKILYDLELKGKRNLCPECTDNRNKKSAKDLQYYENTNRAYCFHCNTTFFAYNPHADKQEYIIPEWKNKTELSNKAVKWFESRMINQQALNKMKVYSDKEYMPQFSKETEVICFPYFANEKLINIKFRGANKSFKLVSGAELIFYNYDSLLKNNEIIICEGEIDLLSWIVCGNENVISVPNGANNKLEYFDSCINVFDNIKKVYLSTDNDTKGIELRDELIRRIGIEKCYIIDFKGCKDANEFLIRFGGTELSNTLKNAKQKAYEGVVSAESMYDDLLNYFEQGDKSGLKLNIDSIDKYISWESSRLAIVTGIPGSGKSEFVDYVLCKLNLLHGWKSALFTPENYPLKYHYEKLFEKLIGKKFSNKISNGIEFDQAFDYIKENFFYIMPEEETTLDYILERTKYLVKTKGIKCLVIDPFNKIEHNTNSGQTETQYISKFLDKLIHFGKLNDILIFLVAHPTKMRKDDSGNYPVPTPYDINGSANWRNKADNCLTIWRDLNPDNQTGAVDIHVQKIRHKIVGKLGSATLNYDRVTGRYSGFSAMPSPIMDMKKNSANKETGEIEYVEF